MNYLHLDYDINPKIVGVNDGAGQAYISNNFLERHSWFKHFFYKNDTWDKDWWKKWANVTAYAQPLSEITMHKKSKLTDFITFPRFMRGFIVNDRLRNLINVHGKLPNHKFLPVTFNQAGNIIEGYWWFVYDLDTGQDTIDFTKSEFMLSHHEKKFNKQFFINSYEDYMNIFYETGSAVRAKKIVFNKDFDKNLDIFGLQFLSLQQAYISERLLVQWEKEKITGYFAKSKENRSLAEIKDDNYCDLIFEPA